VDWIVETGSTASVLAKLEQHLFGDRLESIKDTNAAVGHTLKYGLILAAELGCEICG
jgi:hypothetical protein